MSLINDALKRAAETKKQTGDPPPSVPLHPVEYARRPDPVFRWVLALMVTTALAMAVWFFARWQSAEPAPAPAAAALAPSVARPPSATVPPTLTAAPPATIQADTNPVVRPDPDPTAIPPTSQAVAPTNPVATDVTPAVGADIPAEAPDAKAVEAPPEPPRFPELKLQSIIYRMKDPAVLIEGQMLQVGDSIREARIVRIERHTVTLEWRGETNVLTLRQL